MANNMPGFASDIAADPLGQRRYNIPNLPFKDMRRQGPVDRLDESVGEATRGMPSMGPFADRLKRLFPQGQMPPELLQMLMMQLMGSQGGSGHRWVAAGHRNDHRWVAAGHRNDHRWVAVVRLLSSSRI